MFRGVMAMLVAATVLWHAVVGCCAHHHHAESAAHHSGSCCGSVVVAPRCEHGDTECPSHDHAAHGRSDDCRSAPTDDADGDGHTTLGIVALACPGSDAGESHDDCADGECVLAVGLIETGASFVSLLDSVASTGWFALEMPVRPESIRIVSSTSEDLGELSAPRGLRRHLSLGKLTC